MYCERIYFYASINVLKYLHMPVIVEICKVIHNKGDFTFQEVCCQKILVGEKICPLWIGSIIDTKIPS